jgi:hypothetical protein
MDSPGQVNHGIHSGNQGVDHSRVFGGPAWSFVSSHFSGGTVIGHPTRVADIPVLVEYFIDRFGKKAGKKFRTIDKKSLGLL